MKNFVHLHVHSQYSILDGACKVKDLIAKAQEYGMPAVALTDHGNMFGIKEFFNAAKDSGVKPILGVEAYVAKKSRFDKKDKEDRSGYHLILLAKNKTGYHNLMKLVSYAHLEGQYYKPRMDKEILREYHEGLIASSACLGGEIPQHIMAGDMDAARKAIEEYIDIFGKEDFYLELMRHQSGDPEMDAKVYNYQVQVNAVLLDLAKEYGLKVIATNDVHFLNKEDADAHDILICLNTGKDCDDPNRMRYTRQEYFASPEEMWEKFADIPEALENTLEIAEKVEIYDINSDPILPKFEIPPEFEDDDAYLRHLTYEGAKERWGEITDDIKERLDFELETIKKMGYPSYFLIVWDFIRAARELGVWVGPGRGSAAGSAVAYCLRITDIDPIKYDLLFERFLNPDRISMPDIDIDFDDDGRSVILHWVSEKYGHRRVANIITFGTMAPKMAIRDVGRVLKVPLPEVDKLAKMIPDKANSFKKAYDQSQELKEVKENGEPHLKQVLQFAEKLEGSVRQTGLHACGVIIGRDDLENYVPLAEAKDSQLHAATQYEGAHVEDVGLLKMDFLGLKTLSIMKDAVENIEQSTGEKIDINSIPLDDAATYQLYSKGETTGTFQFESDGMKKYLRQLKPNRFDDLIAMNALYRPGPMDYIPEFIDRKHGRKKIVYDVPQMEEILKDTYGITVYQEQVMLLSRKLAGFTRGEADTLRKAMGKKKKKLIDQMKPKFIEGCAKNGIPQEKAEKIWADWEAFASYAFNKSHATCYAYVAYQTAYLKAHYPAQYMAAVLSRNISDIKKVAVFMDECKRMRINVLGPDVNESRAKFTVNEKGEIRFGMAAIKGVGEAVVDAIVKEREKNGPYKDIYDFVERVPAGVINKKVMENLVKAGAFDNLSEYPRAQYFEPLNGNGGTFLEELLRYGARYQQSQVNAASSLFGETKIETNKPKPTKIADEWDKLERLNTEKELIGIYLSAHPLDEEKVLIDSYATHKLADIKGEISALKGREIILAGIVVAFEKRLTKTGKPWGQVTIEDFSDSHKFALFGNTYTQFAPMLEKGAKVFVHGKVEPRFRDSTELEFKIKQIKFMEDVKIDSIAIKLPLDLLDDDFIEDLMKMVETRKGNSKLEFLLFDPQTKVWVQMQSKKYQVEVDDDLLNFLQTNNITYKLN